MTTLDTAVELIKGFEGFVDHVYDDGYGTKTIGYGETNSAILKRYKNGITEAQASDLLRIRVQQVLVAVVNACGEHIPTDNQLVAYTSLAYNIGIEGFQGSTTLRKFLAGDLAGAAEAILLWNKAGGTVSPGLVKRRQYEHDLFLAGQPPTVQPLALEQTPTVKLVCMNSALCLDVAEMSDQNGASIIQYQGHGDSNQEWAIVPIPGGNPDEVAIVSFVGKVLDVAMWSTEPGARVQQWDYLGGDNQRWRILSTGNVLEFQNVHSGLFLDVRGMSVDAGADLIQWTRTSNLNQMFMRVRQERLATINLVQGPPSPAPTPTDPVPDIDVAESLKQLGFPVGDSDDVLGFQQGFSFWDLDEDGDAGPETIKAIKYCLDNGGRCGKYFTFAEFKSHGDGRIHIRRVQVRALDLYREAVGPVPVVSGYRDPAYNASIGGASDSQHKYGTATDVPGAVTVGWLKEKGWFSGIGYVPSENDVVVHVDSRGDGPNNTTGGSTTTPTTWEY